MASSNEVKEATATVFVFAQPEGGGPWQLVATDQLRGDPRIVTDLVGPVLVGEDPGYRKRIWQRLARLQRLHLKRLPDRIIAVVDVALWDLIGKIHGQPVHGLLGTYRDTRSRRTPAPW